jgi:thiamine-phosphate diphosphorylase
MISKRRFIKGPLLYVILDSEVLGTRHILKAARRAIRGGADILQFRDKTSSVIDMIKTASLLKRLAARHKVPLIVNDRAEVACAINSDGIHVGRGDLRITTARRLVGTKKILGASAGDLLLARRAVQCGADYVGCGPVFPTPLKKDRKARGIKELARMRSSGIPFFAIGGINTRNVRLVASKGFRNIAVIRAICASRDSLRAARILKEALA